MEGIKFAGVAVPRQKKQTVYQLASSKDEG
jgi:hypothetical protein